MFRSFFRRTSAAVVGVAVAGVMALGLALPAQAFNTGCVSSVTCNPANVLMLAEAGVISTPAAAGGTVASVAAPSTAGSAVGGALGLLGGVGSFLGITQLFAGPGGAVEGGGTFNVAGTPFQILNVSPNFQDPDSIPWLGGWNVPSILCKNCDANNQPIYAASYKIQIFALSAGQQNAVARIDVVQQPGYSNNDIQKAGPHYCMNPTDAGDPSKWVQMEHGPTQNVVYWDPVPRQTTMTLPCPAGKVLALYAPRVALNAQVTSPADLAVKAGSTERWGAPGTIYFSPAQPGNTQPGQLKRHLYCADPVNPGGPLVDYMTAQIATLQPGQKINLQEQVCPSGKVAADTKTDWVPDNPAKPTVNVVPSKGVTPTTLPPPVVAAMTRPDCLTGTCVLTLDKSNGQTCGPTGGLCPDWAKDPHATDNYTCKFGGQVVSINACSAYRAPTAGVLPNANANGDYLTPTAPVPTTSGQPTIKPGTSTGTGPGTGPGSGTGTAPVPAPTNPTNPNNDPQGCRPSSNWIEALTSFNLFTTMGCVLADAFVPKRDIAADANGLKDRVMLKAPVSWVSSIQNTAPQSVGGKGVCPAWVVNVGQHVGGQNTNFSKNVVCDSTFIQAIVNARPALFALITGAMVWPLCRSLWYAMIPVVKVIPTGGGK